MRKTILITGASSGLGEEMARQFAARGHDLALCARRVEKLEALKAEIVAAQCLNGRVQPFDVAAMALFLASDDARFCTAHNYWVDAGWR